MKECAHKNGLFVRFNFRPQQKEEESKRNSSDCEGKDQEEFVFPLTAIKNKNTKGELLRREAQYNNMKKKGQVSLSY